MQTTYTKAVKVFPSGKDFDAYYAAIEYLESLGYVIGSMCGNAPIGFSKQYDAIAKWRNLNEDERLALDGVITSDGFRDCDVTIRVKPEINI